MDSLEELVRRAREGDEVAYTEIVRRLSARAVGTARLVSGDHHLGEEAAQDAFLCAWRNLSALREVKAFRAWFGRILVRTAGRHRREALLPLDAVPEPVSPDEPEEQSLPRVARSLRPMYRDVLALRYVDGLSYREIAAALSISTAKVKSRLHDGRELLRQRLLDRGREI